jgi:LysR family transcriptional regulator, carnitine catabolism transcriptional activator
MLSCIACMKGVLVDLTVQQLRMVLAVERTGSFTAASDRLHLAQSSLSRAVADVERRVGVPLFERTTRRVHLTAEGQQFVEVASDIVRSFDRGMNHFSGFLDGTRGVVRIATLPSLAATLLPPLIAQFREAHPHVDVRIDDALLGQVLEQVTGGHVDFAVTVTGERAAPLEVTPVASDRFFCVFPRRHRFAGSSHLQWVDLQDEPFIAFDPVSSVRGHVDQAFAQVGAVPQLITEARNIATVGGLVAAGLGVSAVPALVLPLLEFAHLGHAQLTDPEIARTISIARDPDRPMAPTAQAFIRAVTQARASRPKLAAGAEWMSSPSGVPR